MLDLSDFRVTGKIDYGIISEGKSLAKEKYKSMSNLLCAGNHI